MLCKVDSVNHVCTAPFHLRFEIVIRNTFKALSSVCLVSGLVVDCH